MKKQITDFHFAATALRTFLSAYSVLGTFVKPVHQPNQYGNIPKSQKYH